MPNERLGSVGGMPERKTRPGSGVRRFCSSPPVHSAAHLQAARANHDVGFDKKSAGRYSEAQDVSWSTGEPIYRRQARFGASRYSAFMRSPFCHAGGRHKPLGLTVLGQVVDHWQRKAPSESSHRHDMTLSRIGTRMTKQDCFSLAWQTARAIIESLRGTATGARTASFQCHASRSSICVVNLSSFTSGQNKPTTTLSDGAHARAE